MPALKSLPAPTEVKKFAAIDNSDSFDTIQPVIERGPDNEIMRIIGCILYRAEATYAIAYDPDRDEWQQIAKADRTHRVFEDVGDFTSRHIAVIDSDIQTEQTLRTHLYAHLRDTYGDVFQTTLDELDDAVTELDDSEQADTLFDSPFACSCDGREFSYLPVTDELDIGRCEGCRSLPTIDYKGTVTPTETVLSEAWIADGDLAKSAIRDVDSDDGIFLTGEDDRLTRADIAIYVLSLLAKLGDPHLSMYNHEYFSALVYIHDGDVAGYATWNDSVPDDEPPIIRQVYVRPEYHRTGVGTKMFTAIMDADIDVNEYMYHESPISEPWALYARAGYADARNRDPELPELVPLRVFEPRDAYPDGFDQLTDIIIGALDAIFEGLEEDIA